MKKRKCLKNRPRATMGVRAQIVPGQAGDPSGCFGVLTEADIVAANIISENFEGNSLKQTSYDLRLGRESLPCGQGGGIVTLPRHDADGKSITFIQIEPLETVIFSTLEVVKMPDNVIGRFDLKIGYGLDGLILQVGPQVHPGYEGLLFGFLLNTRGEPKRIQLGEVFLLPRHQ